MTFYEELQWRGLVKDVTDREGLQERLQRPATCYCGFDPTADSLHVGHLQQILLLRRYQQHGHTPIAVCGGATGMIGDPRPTTERKLLTLEEVAHNAECIKQQLSHFLRFDGDNAAIMVNNYDWLSKLNIIEFLRDYGKHFNVSYMINKDVVASRLEKGISFTEFTYTILQAADWLHLYETYHCELQIGGSDQWGNLTSGMELIRKIKGDQAKVYGITSSLITKSDGTKFGKSEGKNVWLDPARTSAYEFYQFWINVADADIIDYLKRLSFKSREEIEELEQSLRNEPHLRLAQKALADELTVLVHGEEGLQTAHKITKVLFGGDIRELNVEQIKMALQDATQTDIADHTELIDAMLQAKVVSSKREARDLLKNGVLVNGERIRDEHYLLHREMAFDRSFVTIRKGKKNYFVLNLMDQSHD